MTDTLLESSLVPRGGRLLVAPGGIPIDRTFLIASAGDRFSGEGVARRGGLGRPRLHGDTRWLLGALGQVRVSVEASGEQMMPEQPEAVTFVTTLSSSGNNTGIPVPQAVIEQLGRGNRPPVLVTVNGYEYRSTVAVMGGQHLIGVSSAVRAATGLRGGDPISVTLQIANSPREVDVPPDFAAAMKHGVPTRQFFDSLSNSLQRYHVDNINAAKAPETRQRRIDKAVALFVAGKQR